MQTNTGCIVNFIWVGTNRDRVRKLSFFHHWGKPKKNWLMMLEPTLDSLNQTKRKQSVRRWFERITWCISLRYVQIDPLLLRLYNHRRTRVF